MIFLISGSSGRVGKDSLDVSSFGGAVESGLGGWTDSLEGFSEGAGTGDLDFGVHRDWSPKMPSIGATETASPSHSSESEEFTMSSSLSEESSDAGWRMMFVCPTGC